MLDSKYPTDRTIFFSDAVFAIAMTLLILEVKIPSAEEVDALGIGGTLTKRIPNFIGFTVSFLVTALFWKAHLQICSHVRKVDSRFIWINTGLLFFVVLMPFSTAIYSNHVWNTLSFGLYCSNIAVMGFLNYVLLHHVIKTENITSQTSATKIKWARIRTLIAPLVFLLCIVLAQFSPMMSRFAFILIFVFQAIGDRVYNKKAKAETLET